MLVVVGPESLVDARRGLHPIVWQQRDHEDRAGKPVEQIFRTHRWCLLQISRALIERPALDSGARSVIGSRIPRAIMKSQGSRLVQTETSCARRFADQRVHGLRTLPI